MRLLNREIREEVSEHIDGKFSIDDIAQYVPAVSAFGLELMGIQGTNSLKERSLVLLTSYILMISVVSSLKIQQKLNDLTKLGTTPFLQGILPMRLLVLNYCGKNTGSNQFGLALQDTLLPAVPEHSAFSITGIG